MPYGVMGHLCRCCPAAFDSPRGYDSYLGVIAPARIHFLYTSVLTVRTQVFLCCFCADNSEKMNRKGSFSSFIVQNFAIIAV